MKECVIRMSPSYSMSSASLASVLKQLNAELHHLADAVGSVEKTVAGIATRSGGHNGHMMSDLQRIDSIGQTLRALADFSDNLSGLVPGELQVDVDSAVSSLLLSDVANRLRSSTGSIGAGSEWTSGEMEIFDF